MSLTESRLAYADCFKVLDAAVADPKGARVPVKDYSAGVYLRMRLHQARKIDRIENKKTYELGHPMHGLSNYDKLVMKLYEIEEQWYVYLERPDSVEIEVQPMSEVLGIEDHSDQGDVEDIAEGDFEEVKVIEPAQPLAQIPDFRRRI